MGGCYQAGLTFGAIAGYSGSDRVRVRNSTCTWHVHVLVHDPISSAYLRNRRRPRREPEPSFTRESVTVHAEQAVPVPPVGGRGRAGSRTLPAPVVSYVQMPVIDAVAGVRPRRRLTVASIVLPTEIDRRRPGSAVPKCGRRVTAVVILNSPAAVSASRTSRSAGDRWRPSSGSPSSRAATVSAAACTSGCPSSPEALATSSWPSGAVEPLDLNELTVADDVDRRAHGERRSAAAGRHRRRRCRRSAAAVPAAAR